MNLSVLIETPCPNDEVESLCLKYWELDGEGAFTFRITDLAAEFGVRSSDISKVVKKYAAVAVPNTACNRCGAPVYARTRSELNELSRLPAGTCDECKAAEKENARIAEERKSQERLEELHRLFAVQEVSGQDIEVSALSLRSAFAIAALLEDGQEIVHGVTLPVADRAEEFAPTRRLEGHLLSDLVDECVIRIHPESAPDAFVWSEENKYSGEFYPLIASYYLVGSGPLVGRAKRYLEAFRDILSRNKWPAAWEEEFPDFWVELCASECELYLTHALGARGLEFNPGDKTRDVVKRGLQWFSLGQMYYFIWLAARGAADYKARSRVTSKQAANSAITRFGGSIDRAYAEGWNVAVYQRGHGVSTSTLWHLLMVRGLNLPDPVAYSPFSRPRNGITLKWEALDSETFERLIFQMVEEADGYEEVQWLMRTNAPDHGRDVSAVRVLCDSLSGQRQLRVVIQCKHWLSRSVRDVDVANEVVSIEHWEHRPFDVLVVATSGRLTADAVTWIERHNSKGARPYIEVWNDAHLESLLAERQHLVLSYELR